MKNNPHGEKTLGDEIFSDLYFCWTIFHLNRDFICEIFVFIYLLTTMTLNVYCRLSSTIEKPNLHFTFCADFIIASFILFWLIDDDHIYHTRQWIKFTYCTVLNPENFKRGRGCMLGEHFKLVTSHVYSRYKRVFTKKSNKYIRYMAILLFSIWFCFFHPLFLLQPPYPHHLCYLYTPMV